MMWAAMTLGGCAFVLSHRYRDNIDEGAARALRALRARLQPARPPAEDLVLAGRVVSALQAGVSLDAALEELAQEAASGSALRARVRAVLDGRGPADPLSRHLAASLASGAPALAGLRSLERALRGKHRAALRAAALSAQCRAQAEVLCLLPWAIAVAVALLDPTWLLRAAGVPVSWVLWGAGTLFAGLGRAWITRSVAGALGARGAAERIDEEALPGLALQLLGAIAAGTDVETALERGLASWPSLLPCFREGREGSPQAARLRGTLLHAARTGAPLREELGAFLSDLQAETEARREERAQRLPVKLLAPLFACFFPGALLVLAGFVWPLVELP